MTTIYQNIIQAKSKGERLLAVLLDPDKVDINRLSIIISKIEDSITTHIFVGGSTVNNGDTLPLVQAIKELTNLPTILFPGDTSQITANADAILWLSLISGRNPEYLIGKHVKSTSMVKASNLEVIPTGYVLIESGKETAVERVTQTKPLSVENVEFIVDTALAGEFLGMKFIYLEAGSGALRAVPFNVIKQVSQELNIPLIVGGGIRTMEQIENAYDAGADMVVIGTAFEENSAFFEDLKKK